MRKKNLVIIKCSQCDKDFYREKSRIREDFNYCSRQCSADSKSKKVTVSCSFCEKEFSITNSRYNAMINKNSQKNIFCSKDCKSNWESANWTRENNPRGFSRVRLNCTYCEKEYEVRNYRKDTSRFCSKNCKDLWEKHVHPQDEEYIEFRRKVAINVLKNQNNKFTKPERMIADYLEKNNIEFIPQYPMFDRFVVDFYLPKNNTVIEALGNYWHGNPDTYGSEDGKKPLTEKQMKNKEKDEFKYNFLTKENFNVLMVWEADIYKNIEECLKNVI